MNFKRSLNGRFPVVVQLRKCNDRAESFNAKAKECLKKIDEYCKIGNLGAAKRFSKRAKKFLRKSENSINRFHRRYKVLINHIKSENEEILKLESLLIDK